MPLKQEIVRLLSEYKKAFKASSIPISYRFLAEFKKYLDEEKSSLSGWAVYADTQYTTGAPYTLTQVAGKVSLPNNGLNSIETHLPLGMTSFYENGKIVGVNGNAYVITIEFGVRPTSAVQSPRISTAIDIGGAVGEIYPRDFTMSKGSGQDHYFLSSFVYYTLDTWEQNGGTFKVQAIGSDVEIFNIRYIISTQHTN